jgi:SWI/SNF-related matrix-associated actin-dependent regulator of chromatin subfamily A member 5
MQALMAFAEKSPQLQYPLSAKARTRSNYSVDNYFKDTLRDGPSEINKAPTIPRAPKQIVRSRSLSPPKLVNVSCSVSSQDIQFFPPELAAATGT